MKLWMAITGLLAMMVATHLQAITLKLSADIELLALDGYKISGSLLKGAEGLELGRGEHQLVFRVVKIFNTPAQPPLHWKSNLQIASFTAHSRSVMIVLPTLLTEREGKHFSSNMQFTLINEHGVEINCRRDRLLTKTQHHVEQSMRAYNAAGKVASVPRFARPSPLSAQVDRLPTMDEDRHPLQPVLRRWFLQVDTATRQRFAMLKNALHAS